MTLTKTIITYTLPLLFILPIAHAETVYKIKISDKERIQRVIDSCIASYPNQSIVPYPQYAWCFNANPFINSNKQVVKLIQDCASDYSVNNTPCYENFKNTWNCIVSSLAKQ